MRVFVCANVFVLPTCVLRFFSEGGYPFSSRFRCSPDLTPFFVIVKRAYKIPGQPSAASELTRDRAKGRWSCIPPPKERENTAVFLSSQKAPFLLFVAWAHQFFSIAFFIHFLKSSTKAYLTPRVVSCVFLSFLKNKTKQQKLCDWFSFGALISAKAKHSRRAIFVSLLRCVLLPIPYKLPPPALTLHHSCKCEQDESLLQKKEQTNKQTKKYIKSFEIHHSYHVTCFCFVMLFCYSCDVAHKHMKKTNKLAFCN
ncbi:membrane-associated protein, putative [Bodo saltans]|uniref:Membrane-associated protein, putative n=1 Tax=Bodo saltans TaxID=75058 RepID=A0A0S4IS97_BODSA|nr:membrane-associated protein, putative [Bodo saltans]|eukprot:CUF47896.1 membrane-associated protein, putative [Bodo saltans]